MILISTSRRPSTRTRSFVKELLGVIPLSFQVTRGKKSIEELKDVAILKGCRRLMIVESKDGILLLFLSCTLIKMTGNGSGSLIFQFH